MNQTENRNSKVKEKPSKYFHFALEIIHNNFFFLFSVLSSLLHGYTIQYIQRSHAKDQ